MPGETQTVSLGLAAHGGAPQWPTSVELGFSGQVLAVRFTCQDGDIWSTFTERDEPLWEEEVVEVFIAPGDAQPRVYYEFEVNPLGALWDGIITNPDEVRTTMSTNVEWNCPGLVWSAWTDEQQNRWGAELRIPLLEVGGPSPVWRVNLLRIEQPRAGRAELSSWSPVLRDKVDFHLPSRFGIVRKGA